MDNLNVFVFFCDNNLNRVFRTFGIFGNYKKMTLNSNFGNRKKLVPTQKPTQKFG